MATAQTRSEDDETGATGAHDAVAATATTVLEWMWPGLTTEENRILPRLLLGLYRGIRQGRTFNKTEAAGLMGLEVGKTAAKYIQLAAKRRWVTIERLQGLGGRAQDLVTPTNTLIDLVEQELEKLQQALTEHHVSEPITRQPQLVREDAEIRKVFHSPDELRHFATNTSELVDTFHRFPHERATIFRELTTKSHFALSASIQLTEIHSESLIASLSNRWQVITPHKQPGTVQFGLLKALFLHQARVIKLFPGTDHYFHRDATRANAPRAAHPDDLQAAHLAEDALRPLSVAPVRPVPGLFDAQTLDGCLLVFGGGTSNVLARLMQEERKAETVQDYVRVQQPVLGLRYVPTCELSKETVQIAGQEFERRYGLKDTETGKVLFPQTDQKNRLTRDYLLVTVIPNILSADSYRRGDKIVLLGGMHGMGTVASSLLWSNEPVLRQISNEVGESAAWQAVIETGDVVHENKRPRAASLANVIACARIDVGKDLDERFVAGHSTQFGAAAVHTR